MPREGVSVATDAQGRDIIARLLDRIERVTGTLHRAPTSHLHKCTRPRMCMGFSKPEDCDCGLDELLAEARRFVKSS